MEMKKGSRSIGQRIKQGQVEKRDVIRRLGELAFGRANDCVKLALEETVDLDGLDLTLLSEVKRNGKGAVEIRMVDRLQVLEKLAEVLETESADAATAFLQTLQGGEET